MSFPFLQIPTQMEFMNLVFRKDFEVQNMEVLLTAEMCKYIIIYLQSA